MKINARNICWSVALVGILMIGTCLPSLALGNIPGKFSLGMGVVYATEQTTTYSYGVATSTSNGATQTKFSWNADYEYTLGKRFGVGASLVNWKFDNVNRYGKPRGGTSLCFMASYLLGERSDAEMFLGAGNDLSRIGYRAYVGKNDASDRGMYYSIEFNAPLHDGVVKNFGGVSLGYSL